MNESDPALELARKIRQIFERHDLGMYEKEMAVAALLRPHVWEWIPVGERLPTIAGEYLVCTDSGLCTASHFEDEHFDEEFVGPSTRTDKVTHWAALPSAPLSLESSNQK